MGVGWSSMRSSRTRSAQERPVEVPLDDDHGSRLLAADIPARCLRRLERRHQPFGEVALGRLVGLRHGRHDLVVEHHVGLDAVAVADVMGGRLDALGAGVGGDVAVSVDKGDLPHVAALVDQEQSIKRLLGRQPTLHELQTARPVGRVDKALGGDRADSGLGPGNDRADREPVRLDGHAHLPGRRITSNDRVRVNRTFNAKCGLRDGENDQGESDSTHGNLRSAYSARNVTPLFLFFRGRPPGAHGKKEQPIKQNPASVSEAGLGIKQWGFSPEAPHARDQPSQVLDGGSCPPRPSTWRDSPRRSLPWPCARGRGWP